MINWNYTGPTCVFANLDFSLLPPPTAAPRSARDHQRVAVKPGSSAELLCAAPSNLAQLLWTFNGSALTEASRFHLVGDSALLIYSVAPEDQGLYECWSVEPAAILGKNFSRTLATYVLKLDVPPPPPPPQQQAEDPAPTLLERVAAPSATGPAETNGKTDVALLTSALAPSTLTSTVRFTPPPQTDSSLTPPPGSTAQLRPRPAQPSGVVPRPDNADPSAEYLQRNNSAALLSLFLLFFLLFLAALAYNCYMQYLPAPCLRLRAALLGNHKSTQHHHQQPEYRACEAGLMEASASEKVPMTERPTQNGSSQATAQNLRALRDTGYETEPECGNGQVPSHGFGDDSSSTEKPFDVDCESQPIQFADADEPYC